MNKKTKNSGIPWIGEIPESWNVSKVKDAFVRKNVKAHQENPIVLSLARSGVKVRDISNNEGQIAESYFDYNPVDIDDLLINPMDLYSGANCSISKVKGVISPAYVNLRHKENVCPRYYDYYFKTQYWAMAFFAHGKGISFDNRWTLGIDTLFNYYIPSPSYEEQKIIADFLDKKCDEIDTLITLQEKFTDELKAYKQSIITEILTKGVKKNAMCNSGIDWIGTIPLGWKICRIKNYYEVSDGTHDTPNYVEKTTETYPLVTSKCIDEGNIVFELANHISKNDYIQINERSYHNKYDVIMPMIGTVGNPAIIMTEDEFAVKNVAIFRTNGDFFKACLLKYFLNSNLFFEQFNAIKRGGVQSFISQEIIRNLIIIVPDNLDEVISTLNAKCNAIEALISQKRKKIEKLNEYKRSIIYEYVTGKKQVI